MLDTTKHFARINSPNPPNCLVLRTFIEPILQMWMLRLGTFKRFAEDDTASKWRSPDLNTYASQCGIK